MQLIIAEKPSLGRNIIEALKLDGEHFTRGDGYQKSQNYTVTWCFGHLFALQDMDDYLDHKPGEKIPWSLEDLPFFPPNNRFRFVLKRETDKKTHRPTSHADPGVQKQFNIISDLLKKADSVVNAGDADREGQVIVDLVLMHAHCRIPSYRLWVNDQTPESIQRGLKNMKPDSHYSNILEEGLTRTYMDWLYGINLTRLATLKSHTLLRVGRVIVPVVQEIVARDRSITSFVPKDYLKCISSRNYGGITLTLTSKNEFDMPDKAKADALCRSYNQSGGIVTHVEKKRKTVAPPKLFSTSKLQEYLEGKMTMKQVLDAAEDLHVMGVISYPRTEADYLFPEDESMVRSLLAKYPECSFRKSSAIFKKPKSDDTSHYALIPTGITPHNLTAPQQMVYDAIVNRFKAVFYTEPMLTDSTTMIINVDGEEFKVSGDIIAQKGWSRIEKTSKKNRMLPDFSEGEHIDVSFAPKKTTTTPPKHYTTAELLSFMKDPFRKEEDTDVQLGTEATRAGIIDNAIQTGYIEQKGRNYYALKKGNFLVDAIDELNFGIDKRQSLKFADILVKVRNSEMSKDDALRITEDEIRKVFHGTEGKHINSFERKQEETLGTCPACGKGQIVLRQTKAGRKFYTCTEHRMDDPQSCSFFMDEKFKRFNDIIDVTKPKMKKLLAGKTIPCRLTARSGKTYEANVKLVMNGRWVNLNPVFDDTPSEELGKCPLCGKPVRSRGKFYSCDGHKDGCQFYIGKTMRYFSDEIPVDDQKVHNLLTGQPITGTITTRSGKKINAEFVLQMNGRFANLQRVPQQ